MKTPPGFPAFLTALLLICSHAGASAEDAATEPSSKPAPAVVTKVTNAIQRGASAAATGIERGVKAAASGVERGVKAAGKGIEKGAQATARGVEKGAQATARGVEKGATATSNAAHKVADKIGGSSDAPASAAPVTDK